MEKNLTKTKKSSFERRALVALSIMLLGVIGAAWFYSMDLRQKISAKNSVMNVDVRALIEVEKLRNLAESQIDNSLTFFLMGSTNLFEEQRKEKQAFTDLLAVFEKQFSLPQVPEIVRRIEGLQQQRQEFFDQGMEYRAKQTESKIVGQFYRAKTAPIRANINKALDEIVQLHNAELDRARARAQEAALDAEVQIPKGMLWFTGSIALLFLCMVFLVMRMIGERNRQLAERARLYAEAQNANLSRDEVIAAISYDLNEPLAVISQAAVSKVGDEAEIIQTSTTIIEDRIKDILDQSRANSGNLTLRLDQLGLDAILEEARLMLLPLAKQKDIRLEFNPVNPPVLAFIDSERVMRVLSNLVGNAIKFSPRMSKVIVKVRSDQQFVYVSVKDSGPGIPEKQLPEIFDSFWQARKTSDQGPGIGLAVVKTVIEAHGGVVSVESHVGHGSTFTFSLPRRRPVGFQTGRSAAATTKNPNRNNALAEFRDGPGL